ncbi:MAG: hypothetical protein JXA71_09580 [Chitinispirillaceae bacterium]|nr:hypothetical protein [Chitinispirillaceae bacterium]
MSHVLALVPGFIVGCMTVLLAWGICALISGKMRQKKLARKEEIISSIETRWTDVDSIVSSYRQGRLSRDAFKNELAQKLEAINRLYKPSRHQLDLYFAKYTERLLEDNEAFLIGEVPAAAFKEVPEPDSTIFQEPEQAAVAPVQEPEVETGIHPSPDQRFEADRAEETAVPEAVFESDREIPSDAEPAAIDEEPVITAMAESSSEASDILPIETFMEMETGMGMAEEPVTPSGESGIEDAFPELPASMETPTPYVAEETGLQQQPLPETNGQAQPEELEPVFDSGESVVVPQQELPPFPEETMMDQPAVAYAPEPSPEPEPLPPPPSFIPSSLERRPGYKRDETVEPATIYDIEAETIIADRSEIMGTKKPAKDESSRSGLGITGDDISDQLDNFFNIK